MVAVVRASVAGSFFCFVCVCVCVCVCFGVSFALFVLMDRELLVVVLID